MVGEFLNIDTDQGLYTDFQHNYREWFPAWNTVHRTTHAKQGYSPKLAEGMFCEIQTTWGGCITPHWTALHERAFEKQLHGESCELTASLPSPRLTGKAREAHGDEAMLAFGCNRSLWIRNSLKFVG